MQTTAKVFCDFFVVFVARQNSVYLANVESHLIRACFPCTFIIILHLFAALRLLRLKLQNADPIKVNLKGGAIAATIPKIIYILL
jgi:hypothetical protein